MGKGGNKQRKYNTSTNKKIKLSGHLNKLVIRVRKEEWRTRVVIMRGKEKCKRTSTFQKEERTR